jgi:hypothetical protein
MSGTIFVFLLFFFFLKILWVLLQLDRFNPVGGALLHVSELRSKISNKEASNTFEHKMNINQITNSMIDIESKGLMGVQPRVDNISSLYVDVNKDCHNKDKGNEGNGRERRTNGDEDALLTDNNRKLLPAI